MNALFAGRLCDIVRHLEVGQIDTARNLVVNTPGVDWTHWLSPAAYRTLVSGPAPCPPPADPAMPPPLARRATPPAPPADPAGPWQIRMEL